MYVLGRYFAGFNMIIKEVVFKHVIFEQRLEEVEVGVAICKSIGEYSRKRKQKMQSPTQEKCVIYLISGKESSGWTPERRVMKRDLKTL